MTVREILVNYHTTKHVTVDQAIRLITEYLEHIGQYTPDLVEFIRIQPRLLNQAVTVAIEGLEKKEHIVKVFSAEGKLLTVV
jgi:hypothetical protein